MRRLLTYVSLFHVRNCDSAQPLKLRSTLDQYYAWFVPIVPSPYYLLQASREKLLHTHIISVSHSELDAAYLSLHQQ